MRPDAKWQVAPYATTSKNERAQSVSPESAPHVTMMSARLYAELDGARNEPNPGSLLVVVDEAEEH